MAAAVVLSLFLIGRFYEVRFGQRSYFQLMLIPLLLFVIAGVWGAVFANHTGDPLMDFVGALVPDLLLFVGGVILIALCYYLYRRMMGGRR
jgi:hypothetical protein